jgi:hypothetical protein
MSFKRRCRPDKLFHYTNSLNRQYIITMTNILFQMQKEIFKLKRRTQHVEQMLANHSQSGQPVIRIPRLTKGKIGYTSEGENLFFFRYFQMNLLRYVLMKRKLKKMLHL